LIFKSEFLSNIFTLLSGATIAQIIALITIPILTRIYSPEDFGFIAIYLSIANIITSISAGRYELAIMLPKKKESALAIFTGSFKIIVIISLTSFLAIVILKSFDNKVSSFIEPSYFYLLPLSIFIIGLSNVFFQWYTRQKEFKLQAKAKIIKSASSSGINVGLGLLFPIKSLGLFFGHIASQGFQLIIFLRKFIIEEKESLKNIDNHTVKEQLVENKNFPYFSAPMAFLNSISVDLLIYVFNIFYSTSLVGLYSNANKVINYPLSLISQSFTAVFYQKIAETNKKIKLYLISYFSNFAIATLAMVPIIFWGEEMFVFALGKDWAVAGAIAKLLTPLTITSFAMRSVSNIFSLTRRNGTLLIWQIIYLLIIIVVIFYSKSAEFENMLFSISIFGSILYLSLAVVGFVIIRNYHETRN